MSISKIKYQAGALILGIALLPSAHAQDYYETLGSRSDAIVSIVFDSLAVVQNYWPTNNHSGIDYDPGEDAMQFTWPPDGNQGTDPDTPKIPISPSISSGTAFISWDEKYGPNWAADGTRSATNDIATFKNYQIASGVGSDRLIEVRLWTTKTHIDGRDMPAGKLGSLDIRPYYSSAPTGSPAGGASLSGLAADVQLDIGNWHRYFLFVDLDNDELSLWVTQPGLPPLAIYHRADGSVGRIAGFWYEHDSSQQFSGPVSRCWNRNLVVLNGVPDLAAAEALVAQGSLGGPTPENPEWNPAP